MKVNLHFCYPNEIDTHEKISIDWGARPLPNVGDLISSTDDVRTGTVKRIEWRVDDLDTVNIVIV